MATPVESVLARPYLSLLVIVVGLPLACWAWVVAMARDMYGPMTGASAWMMTVTWDTPRLVLLWAMWAAMMAGMMLPSLTPVLLLYARALCARLGPADAAPRIYALAGGYVLVWACFSVAATGLQWVFAEALVLTPMMEPASTGAAAALLFVAGAYQLTPFKSACLQACRSPITALVARWKEGRWGAFRMGLSHGVYCLGCCWALMLLLFAGGVMNLAVILALTVWVAVEKLAPFGPRTAPVSGVLLVAAGAWMLMR